MIESDHASQCLVAGLGDRHQQNGVNYTLDLNAGLTQVLSDGANTYLYGNGRIAQAGSTTEYFLGDALGSVRQLADTTGSVTLTQSYSPYGEMISSVGTGASVYQFTGESRDDNGLTYLRARYMNSSTGRFISRDTWNGDYNRPLSLNRWNYVEGNPVNLTDPSGQKVCPYGTYVDDDGNVICRHKPAASDGYEGPWVWEHSRRQATADLLFDDENATCPSGGGCLLDLMARGYYHEPWAVITGKGLELLANDPALLNWQYEIVKIMRNDYRYRREAFSVSEELGGNRITFGEYGGGKLVQATHAETWMVRLAWVEADAHATKLGNIYINYYLEDTLDLRPDWEDEARTNSGYNLVTCIVGGIWHDALGASDEIKVYAQWTAVIELGPSRH